MTFVTGQEWQEQTNKTRLSGKSERRVGIRRVQMTWNSLGGVYFGFQSFQIGDRYGAAVDLEHSFCL